MNVTRLVGIVLVITCGASFARSAVDAGDEDRMFLKRDVEVNGTKYAFRVYVPPSFATATTAQELPILLFLHGAGERGNDNAQQTRVGLGAAIKEHPERFPLVVVMPQCARGSWWTEKMEEQALAALAAAEQEFHTDKNRVYLSGLSMGGYATWAIAGKHPARFAGIIVVCGGVRAPWERKPLEGNPYADAANKVKHLPIWIFHGAADATVPVEESRKMRDELNALNAGARYTEYEGVGHDSWDQAYREPELIPWLLSHARG